MRVGLFIPCYVDQLYPDVAIATLELLEKAHCDVYYPNNQTCCGQPMANAGYASFTFGCNENFIRNFNDVEYIVCPSGSCVLHIKEHLKSDKGEIDALGISRKIFELTEFLTDVIKYKTFQSFFPHTVGLHISCHGQRMLHLASMSEKVEPAFSKTEVLLNQVTGLKLVKTKRVDECCGFGGTFCVTEEAISVSMGKDRILEHMNNEVEFITAGDMSCLMHLEGILRRIKSNIKVIHIAEILNAR